MTSASNEQLADTMRCMADRAGVPQSAVNITPGLYHDLMDRADAALVTSGTATMEAALHELPLRWCTRWRRSPISWAACWWISSGSAW